MAWTPDSWRRFEARQQPVYDNPAALAAAEQSLAALPPLVELASIEALTTALAEAQRARAFLLQGGDCAESFAAFSPAYVHSTAHLLADMAEAIADGASRPVVRVGRIAGQFAKPRSAELERRSGETLPVYRGDIVNGLDFDAAARRADPGRMLRAYRQAAATLALLRDRPAVFASHEALLLPYEQALVRTDPDTGRTYSASGHMLWIGDRTRFPGSAHVEFARGLANPLGVKCGPSLDGDDLLRLIDRLNPEREHGRITLISRMGEARLERALPPLIRAVRREGHPVLWACDPMHGNTIRTADGAKDRPLPRILAETRAFFALAAAESIAGGGLHVEMTGQEVVECSADASPRSGPTHSPCDPRLNRAQAMALARLVAAALAHAVPVNPAFA